VVLANANRSKLSVISTVTNKGQMRWKVFSGALTAKVLIAFMKRLVHGHQKRIFLVLDILRVHHSKLVKQWLEENEDKIVAFYLPSYSPELNPEEFLNGGLKQQVTKSAPARNKIALTRTAVGALRSIQKLPERVEKYFGQKDAAYAA
jgi:tRNA U34 5-methylaminomethyl-2-thiouridine-forming methyltransferase MnmC